MNILQQYLADNYDTLVKKMYTLKIPTDIARQAISRTYCNLEGNTTEPESIDNFIYIAVQRGCMTEYTRSNSLIEKKFISISEMTSEINEEDNLVSLSYNPVEEIEYDLDMKGVTKQLNKYMLELSPKSMSIVKKHLYDDISLIDISRHFGDNENTTRAHYRFALKVLSKRMTGIKKHKHRKTI